MHVRCRLELRRLGAQGVCAPCRAAAPPAGGAASAASAARLADGAYALWVRAEGAPRRHALFDTAAWVRGFERGLLLLRELRHVGDCRRAAAEAAAAGNATLARRRPHRTFPEVAEMAMHVVVSAS